MTIASELFYERRSRFGRNTVHLGLDSSVDGISHHLPNHNNRRHLHHYNNNNRRDRLALDGCEPPRRSSHLRHPINRLSHSEREPVRPDQGGNESASGNVINSEAFGNMLNRPRFTGNDRLPGAVLLARERLLERLRGVSISANRQSNGASSGIHHNDFTFGGNNSSFIDPEYGESEATRAWLAEMTPSNDTNPQTGTGRLLALQETRKHPPGLTQEALECLHIEFFNDAEKCDEAVMSRASRECSICLESFQGGDEMICLPCGHRFHSCCLDPWVRTCGDCPNCRTGIAVTGYSTIK